MSNRYDHESYHQTQQISGEAEDAAHAHLVGELHGKQDHLTGNERTRHEHESADHLQPHPHGTMAGHGITSFGHADIASLAYELWERRGCPSGSPEVDWFEAVKELRSRALSHH
jgi:hypothetical protein